MLSVSSDRQQEGTSNALSYFSLPDNKTRQCRTTMEGSEVVLALAVFCNLENSFGSTLTLVELKGYYDSSEFSNIVPDLARAQSHTIDKEYDAPLPVMLRGTSAFESGQSGVSRELVDLPLYEVRQEKVSNQSYNFYMPIEDIYFDGSFEIHGTLLWSTGVVDEADQTFHFSLQLPNSCHTHFAQIAYGAIFTANTSALTIARGLLTCLHPMVSDMMQIRPLGRTYCYSDIFWVIRAFFTYFQNPSAVFPPLTQGDAMLALVGHVRDSRGNQKVMPQHAPLFLAGIGVITSLLVEINMDARLGSLEGTNVYKKESMSVLCSLAESFFQPEHKELLKQLCNLRSDEEGGKTVFFESDHFFAYFRSLRQALLFLVEADTRGSSAVSPYYSFFVALRHVVPLLLKPKIAALKVAELYRSESEVFAKTRIYRLESSMRDDLWAKLNKFRYVNGVRQFPSTVSIADMCKAKDLVTLMGNFEFTLLGEGDLGHALGLEILKIQQYQEQELPSADIIFETFPHNLLDPSMYIRKMKVFQAAFVNMTRHLTDFASFFASYTRQCTEEATLSNFWSLEEYRAALQYLKRVSATGPDEHKGLLLLWAGGSMKATSAVSAKGEVTMQPLSQPWGVACGDLLFPSQTRQQHSSQPSLLVSGANSTLHLLHSNTARTLVANGPGALPGGLDVAQLRGAKSLCVYTVQLRGKAVTLLVIADTGNNSVRALVLSSSCQSKTVEDDDKVFPHGKLFELAKISNPVSVCVFQDQIVVASHNTHVLYSVVFEKKKTLKQSNAASFVWVVNILAGKLQCKGVADGQATTAARLYNPAQVTASSQKLYFVEVRIGTSQAVREYDSVTGIIKTLHTGDPFKNLTGLCCASSNELFICDRGNSCVWGLDTESGGIRKVISEDDVPLRSVESADPGGDAVAVPPFRPGCILKVANGSFVIADVSRNQIFRYLDVDTVRREVETANIVGIFDQCDIAVQNLEVSVSNCLATIRDGLIDFKECVGQLFHLRKLIVAKNYVAEAASMKRMIREDALSLLPEAITGMILNAPSIAALNSFLKLVEIHPNDIFAAKDAVVKYMKQYDFSSYAFVDASEFLALGEMFRYSRDSLVGQDLMCVILKDDEFRFDVTPNTLTMLGGLLQRLNWTMDRQKVPDLRREVVRWLGRCLPPDALLGWVDSTHEEVLMGALRSWSSIMQQFEGANNYCKKVLAWIVRVHLDSLCMGFVTTFLTARADRDPVYDLYSDAAQELPPTAINRDSSDKVIQKNIDRAVLTIRSLPYLFEEVVAFEVPYDLLTIFSETVCDVARTLQVETAVRSLLQASVVWGVACSARAEVEVSSSPRVHHKGGFLCPFSFVFQHVLFEITSKQFSIFESKVVEKMRVQYNKAKNNPKIPVEYVMELENNVKHPPNWEFQQEAIIFEPFLWAHLLHWHHASIFQHSRAKSLWSNDLLRYNNRIASIFSELATNVCRGHVSTDMLRKIHTHGAALRPGFAALTPASPLGNEGFMKSLEMEFQDALAEVETLTKVLAVISPPKCDHLSNMYTLSNSWHTLTLNSIRSTLRLDLPPDHDVHSASFLEFYGLEYFDKIRHFETLPEQLLRSLPWLYTCTNLVDFFAQVWQEHNEDGDVTDAAILHVARAWQHILQTLSDGSISCATLTNYFRFFSSPVELFTLLRTGQMAKTEDTCWTKLDAKDEEGGFWNWMVIPDTDADVLALKDTIMADLLQWHKIKRFTNSDTKVFVGDLLTMSENFLSSAAESALQSWKNNYLLLCSSVETIGKSWCDLTMNEVLAFTSLAAPLDDSILNISMPLLTTLANNEKLNIFLRSVVNDNAFSSALEVALGLTEMECPTEIWDSTSNRVNEKFLSMLRNIRSYLYVYFYEYPIKLQSFDSFIFIFGSLNSSMIPEVIAQNIDACGVVRQALMDIINFTSEGASSNRLMKIYEPTLQSCWSCVNSSSFCHYKNNHPNTEVASELNNDHDLFLEYIELNRMEDQSHAKTYALNELLDFQSNVVLSKSSDLMSEDYLQAIIDRFLHQFCWMRRLRESLINLHSIGHFDYYPQYQVKFSVSVEDNNFVDAVSVAEAKAKEWIQRVNSIRERYYFLNYYEMKNVRKFLDLLMTLSAQEYAIDSDDSIKTIAKISQFLSDMLCFVNIEYTNDVHFLQASSAKVLHLWNAIKASQSPSAAVSEYLEDICGILNSLCEQIPGRSRPALFDDDLSLHSALPHLRPGLVYATKAATSHAEYSQALTMFGSLGIFPEWETCLLCSQYTTEEQVCNFIRRWQKSHLYRTCNQVFYLIEVQKLTYAIQDAVIVLLRNMSSTPPASSISADWRSAAKPCALVLSCLSGKYQCPLAAQFHHNSLSIQAFPNHVIAQMFKSSTCAVEVHHSLAPGAGKTFNIRTKSASTGRHCVFVPINNASMDDKNRSDLIHRMRTAVAKASFSPTLMLHLDISSSVGASLPPLLFEVCILGLSQDYAGENIFWYPPETVVCVELACGLLEQKLQHCAIYPSVAAVANRNTFLFDETALQVGMGGDFDSPLYDGTIEDDTKSNAFRRLRYVCVALSVLLVGGGTFPYDFEVQPPELCPDMSSLSPEERMGTGVSTEDSEKETTLLARDLGKTLVIKEKNAEKMSQDNVREKAALTGAFLDGARSFDLLFRALGKKYYNSTKHVFRQNDHMSLWCLWNFVNVLYWQLREMHHVESPLNGACMPDKQSELRSIADDIRAKRKIKGEIIQFMIKTAREFAIRQSVVTRVKERRITDAKIEDMSRGMFNKRWARTLFDNDGQPCFTVNRGEYYLYYRALANCWVIDDVIESTGATYCYSRNGNINSAWTVSPSWEYEKGISARCTTLSTATKAYRNEVVIISGCSGVAADSSCSYSDDGTYLRQPPYDDINKSPHYIKDKDHPKDRRHLFLSQSRHYSIAPQCNEDQGFFVMSNSSTIHSQAKWQAIPPDKVENKVKVTFIYSEDEEEEGGASESKGEEKEQKEEGRGGGNQGTHVNHYELEVLRWQDSNHESGKLLSQLHPLLVNHLHDNRISIEGGTGEEGESDSSRCWQMLAALTNIYKTDEERKNILGGSYCLTGDALLKILAIQYRVRCGIPVVLLGECGCGKTMLLRFLCAWLNVKLLCLDVHGGTTEADIIDIFNEAERMLKREGAGGSLYIFLDEINTCSHMGIITEAISHRSINGVRIHEGIKVLAALNPYRQRSSSCFTDVTSGLQQVKTSSSSFLPSDSSVIDMSNLVYKVHPIPDTLKDFIFDFGALSEDTESLYINRMVEKKSKMSMTMGEKEIISYLISRSQSFLREREGDPSVVSLRDVQRCIDLLNWFYFRVSGAGGAKQKISPLCRCTILAIAHVYAYRLPTSEDRYSFWLNISSIVKSYGKAAEKVNFYHLSTHGLPQRVIDNMQRRFVNNLVIENDVSMNQALTENLFVTIVCLLNKIPIFIVGKPGTSKTLCIQIIASNLQGAQSIKPLWRNFPAVHFFQYQCSPMSTADSILFQYEAARSYQEHSQDVLTALLLDEVGLAENSPDMPLKVLHYMLIDPPIAIIGLSNWVLDSSKMNRAVCLQRPDPSKEDIILTGKNIIGADTSSSSATTQPDPDLPPTLTRQSSRTTSYLSNLQPFLVCLARAFHVLYSNQQEFFGGSNRRDFIGMRDYYSLLKFIKESDRLQDIFDPVHGPLLLVEAVSRNFGGQPASLPAILNVFFKQCYENKASWPAHRAPPPVLKLIMDSLESASSRHLMILSSNDIALQLVLGYGIIPRSGLNILIGSHFKDDIQELHLIQQINQVKNAMAMGKVVALLNNDSMFESLYDVLNQRYVYKQDVETGKDIKMLRLALGPRSQLCPVKDGFKLIVFVDQQKAYDTLDLPLLNRFEKQVLYSNNFLDENGLKVLDQLQLWCEQVCSDSKFKTLADIFCGFYSGTLSSLLVLLTNYGRTKIVPLIEDQLMGEESISMDLLLHAAKQKLLLISYPTAILKSKLLREEESLLHSTLGRDSEDTPYVSCLSENRTSLCSLLSVALFPSNKRSKNKKTEFSSLENDFLDKMLLLTTKSPLPQFYLSCDSFNARGFADKTTSDDCSEELALTRTKVLQLALINSEQKLVDEVRSFYMEEGSTCAEVLFLLCDPMYCPDEVISHSRLLCVNEWKTFHDKNVMFKVPRRRNIVFIIHLPPGIRQRERQFIVEFHAPWHYAFIDDLRSSSDIDGVPLKDMITQSCFSLFSQERYRPRLLEVVQNSFQSALAWRNASNPSNLCSGVSVDVSYVKVLKELLAMEVFVDYVIKNILICLEQNEYGVDDKGRDMLFFHVAIACNEYDNIGGSFSDALINSMEHLILQAMAHIIRTLDHDFNILTLHQLYVPLLTEWITTASYFCGKTKIAKACTLVTPSRMYDVDKQVYNSGLHGSAHCGQFPFSYKLFQLCAEPTVKKRVEVLTLHHAQSEFRESTQFLTSFLESIMGSALVAISKQFASLHPLGFLSDFVAFAISPAHGMSFSSHLSLFTRLMDVYNVSSGLLLPSEQLYSPVSVLTFYWMHEVMLNHLLAILSAQYEVSASSDREYKNAADDESLFSFLMLELVVPSAADSDYSLDYLVPLHVMRYLQAGLLSSSSLQESPFRMAIDVWTPLILKVMTDVRVLLQLLISFVPPDTQNTLVSALYLQCHTALPPSSSSWSSLHTPLPLEEASLSSLFALWWNLSASFCIVKELSPLLKSHAEPFSVLNKYLDILRNDTRFSPFDNGDNLDVVMKLCVDTGMAPVVVVRRFLDAFVRAERDFIMSCIPHHPFFIPDKQLDKMSDLLLSLDQSFALSSTMADRKSGVHEKVDDAECNIDEVTEEDDEDRIATKAAAHQYSLHRLVVKILKENAISANKYLSNNSNSISDNEVKRATGVLACLSKMCNFELYRDEAFQFYITTIQILSTLIEDEEEVPFKLMDRNNSALKTALAHLSELDEGAELAFSMLAEDPMRTLGVLALTRRSLLQYCSRLMEAGIGTKIKPSSKQEKEEKALIEFTNVCTIANIFFLKNIRSLGGNDALVDYMRLENPPIAFVPNSKRVTSDKKVSMMNPFLTLQGSESFIAAVKGFGLNTSTFASFTKWRQDDSIGLDDMQRIGLVLGVFYYKVDTLTVDIHLFKRFLSSLSPGNHQSLYHHVLEWMARLPKCTLPTKMEIILEELKVHAVILALQNPAHFFLKILTCPSELKTTYLPSMPRSDMEEVMSAYGSSVGWYKCPNGHLYTVGACTYPMEERVCTAEGCHAKIGGQNHVVNAKNKRLAMDDSSFQGTPGYHTSVANDAKENLCLSNRVLRLMIHALMAASMEIRYASAGSKGNVARVMSHTRTSGFYLEEIQDLFAKDFDKIKKFTGYTNEDVSMGLHLTLATFCNDLKFNNFRQSLQLTTHILRCDYEMWFESVAIRPVFGHARSLGYIQKVKESYNMSDDTLLLLDIFGENNWLGILESSRLLATPLSYLKQCLWQMREPVSFDTFTRFFRLNSSLAKKHPVLHVVLENESALKLVKYIGDILAWHNFLFAHVPSDTTREQAASIKNVDVITSLSDPSKQAEGYRILTAYCVAFNDSFHLVEYLYECNPNPFLTKDGKVDLTGSRGKGGEIKDMGMCAHTSINFSLPSASHGETDATGLCTIKLLSALEEAHNTVIMTLHQARSAARLVQREMEEEARHPTAAATRERRHRFGAAKPVLRPGLTPEEQRLREARGEKRDEGSEGNGGEDAQEGDERVVEKRLLQPGQPTVPTTHHGTPANVISRRLIHYERSTYLLPLIAAAANQSLSLGSGGRIQGFDFDSVEKELTELLLANSSPLALQCAQFSYAGEIRKSGGLRRLGAKITQTNLADALIEQILTEIDTQMRLTQLVRVLEDCISFVNQMPAAIAVAATAPSPSNALNMPLEDYILNTLLLKPSKWDEIKCPTLVQHVHLCHLQSLFLALESKRDATKEGGGDPLHQVALKYREPLPESVRITVCSALAMGDIDCGVFIPLLREFASEQLCTDGWPADAGLKEYMGYSSETDLDELQWFTDPQILPEELELRHAYALYHTLMPSK